MIDVPDNADANRPPVEGLASTVDCVAVDFRRLVETLTRVLDVIDKSHPDLSPRVSTMKDVAERGLDLSRELLLLMKGGN